MMAGLIIAGGKGLRMAGADKLMAPLGGSTVMGRVVAALQPQVEALALNVNAAPERFAGLKLSLVADQKRFTGNPLAGVLAGFFWARGLGAAALVTVSGDTPFLPPDLVAHLARAGGPAIAASGGRLHPLVGLWPVSLHARLEDFLKGGPDCRVGDWAVAAGARAVEWPATPVDPFFNINTRADLDRARQLAEREHG